MKNFILLTLLIFSGLSLTAQYYDYDRYTVSGGLLGAYNLSEIRIGGDNTNNVDYEAELGWSAGAWVNIPLGRKLSVEPQVLFSYYPYRSNSNSVLVSEGSVNYISVPISLKYDILKNVALTLGPQFDFVGDTDEYPRVPEEDITSPSISVSGGLELFPHSTIVFFGRYIYGVSNLDNTGIENPDAEYYNSNLQFGLKLRLFGKVIPADADGDGIPDKDDICPETAGIEKYFGYPIPDTDKDGFNDEVDKCVKEPGVAAYQGCPVPDTDGDGIKDDVDKCPKVAGVAAHGGCPIPDRDGDGVLDDVDACPDVKGLVKYKGCPIPDTDKDGLDDETDKCPTQAGTAANGGCPDRDNDGIIDGEDRCPDLPGKLENGGCPVIESAKFSTQRIQFVTGSANLTADAKINIKEGAKLLNSTDFSRLKVEVRGHTDDTGDAESNLKLSQRRADAVKAELIKNGVAADRITTVGFGETQPLADNKTAEGRTKNRRVAFDVRQ